MVEVNPRYHPQHGQEGLLKQFQKNGLKCEIVRKPAPEQKGAMVKMVKSIREEDVRDLNYCIGCTKPKAVGLVVCWECFSRRTDIVPFKYFKGTLVEWLNQEKKKG